ncbi:MAG: DRTGG domain-containing protein [Dehalococcoidia bacterium]|nr:DRTGG domain-containing protein [Dehalococcoidia bacterium]|tara:strand:- start:493 stop:1485 length:993 start_codon:yes stop_codon:yes gene_type:complete
MKTILVTSLNPKDGKTSCALGLAKSLNDQGYKSTCIELFNSNIESSQTSFIKELHPNEIGSFPYSINLANKNKIIEDIKKFNDTTDYLIIDTLSLSDTSQEIAEFLLEIPESSIIIIIKLETSDSITTIREKLNAASTIVPKNISGVIFNSIPKYSGLTLESNIAKLREDSNIPILGSIPQSRTMKGITSSSILNITKGILTAEHPIEYYESKIIERIMIGGMVLGSGKDYFNRFNNKAVLVRGNRPDIQMAAINNNTSCLIFTGEHTITDYIKYHASEEEIPIISVNATTQETLNLISSQFIELDVLHKSKITHLSKLIDQQVTLSNVL